VGLVEPFAVVGRLVGVDDYAGAYAVLSRRLVRVAALIVGDKEVAADAVAEAFAKVYPKWRAGKVEDLGAYLHRAVVNEALSVVRSRRIVGSAVVHVGDHADHVADHRAVLDALQQLKPKARAMLVLRYFVGLSEAETAVAIGVPVGTVKSGVARALAQLRPLLADGDARERHRT
jgi:RNA polymerase sigma factor (sigma-70 family)